MQPLAKLLATLLGHVGPVTSVAFSPDGLQIVVASFGGAPRAYRVIMLSELAEILK